MEKKKITAGTETKFQNRQWMVVDGAGRRPMEPDGTFFIPFKNLRMNGREIPNPISASIYSSKFWILFWEIENLGRVQLDRPR